MDWLLFSIFLIGISLVGMTDFLSYDIPNKIVFPIFLLGIIYQLVFGDIKTMIIGFIVSFTIGFISWYLKGMAGGDVKLMATIGVWLGYESFIIITFIACFFGLLWSIVDFIKQRKLLESMKRLLTKLKLFSFIGFKALDLENKDLKRPIPFGSCLALATVMILIV